MWPQPRNRLLRERYGGVTFASPPFNHAQMIELTLLGGLRMARDGTEDFFVSVRSRLILLAVVALSGDRGVRRERLTALVWPDSDDERARAALRQTLFAIKRAVGGAELVVGTAELRLNSDEVSVDVHRFQQAIATGRLDEAAGHYTGPFLDGVTVRVSAELEHWIEDQRNALAAEYGRLLERLASQATERGDLHAAARWWGRAASHDRVSARIAREYMVSLAAAGDRESAIRHAAVYAETVHAVLEIEPDVAVRQFAASLAVQEELPLVGLTLEPAARSLELPKPETPIGRETQRAVPTTTTAEAAKNDALSAVPAHRVAATAAPTLGRWVGRAAWAGAAALALALVGSFAPRAPAESKRVRVVAVTAIRNATGNPQLDGLAAIAATGIREHLMTTGVRVVEENAISAAPGEALVRVTMQRAVDSLAVSLDVLSAIDGHVLVSTTRSFSPAAGTELVLSELQQTVSGAVAVLSDSVYYPSGGTGSRPPKYNALQEFRQIRALMVGETSNEQLRQRLDRLIQLDPDFAEARVAQIEVTDATGAPPVVVDSLVQEAIRQRDRLGAYDRLALDRVIAFVNSRMEEAYVAARGMVELAPRGIDGYLYLVHSAMATRRLTIATQAFHQLQNLGGWSIRLAQLQHWDLQAHRLLKEYNIGLAELSNSRRANRLNAPVCDEGIRLLANLGREAGVDSLVAECVSHEASRGSELMHVLMSGRQFRRTGFVQESDRAYARALALPQARPRLGQIYAEMGRWTDARAQLTDSAARTGGASEVTRAIVWARTGDSSFVRTMLALPLASNLSAGDRANAHMNRAFLHLAIEQRAEAVAELQRALDNGLSPVFNGWFVRWELRDLWGTPAFEAMLAARE